MENFFEWTVWGSIPVHTGEPLTWIYGVFAYGSIPVHTGEPRTKPIGQARARVYPRTHGGTFILGIDVSSS